MRFKRLCFVFLVMVIAISAAQAGQGKGEQKRAQKKQCLTDGCDPKQDQIRDRKQLKDGSCADDPDAVLKGNGAGDGTGDQDRIRDRKKDCLDEDPQLLVFVSDSNGINTIGSGIGHDITAVLDQQTNQTIVLNDFYEADTDSYQSGAIRYQLKSLEAGQHSMKVKVWDVHNNSSEQVIEFTVNTEQELILDHVLNYPNPFTTYTQFFFEHNQPNADLDVLVQIFTISGKLVKTIDYQQPASGYRVGPIEWDGKDDYGGKIGRGVYIYRLKVRTSMGHISEKYEKLVILN